jgi:hypothetical protein
MESLEDGESWREILCEDRRNGIVLLRNKTRAAHKSCISEDTVDSILKSTETIGCGCSRKRLGGPAKTNTASARGANDHQEIPCLRGFLVFLVVCCVKFAPEIKLVNVGSSIA